MHGFVLPAAKPGKEILVHAFQILFAAGKTSVHPWLYSSKSLLIEVFSA